MCKHVLTQPHSEHAEHDARNVQLTKIMQDVFMQKQNIHNGHITNLEEWEKVM